MFFRSGITGNDLAPKTVCLTFDDGPGETEGPGPGPRTLELARYLSSRGIPATFFVVGEFAAVQKQIVKEVAELGHVIGNHTYAHTRLAEESGSFAADQIARTGEIISECGATGLRCFRPPHGRWSARVAGELNWTEASAHIGPVMWDIDGADWRFWSNGGSAADCAAAYVDKLRSVDRGIVIMHDSSFEAELRAQNWSFETVKLTVDWLAVNDYSFVGLDQVPQMIEARRISSVIALQSESRTFLSPVEGGGGALATNAQAVSAFEPLGLVELGQNRIALRCLSGQYLSAGEDDEVTATAAVIDDSVILTREELGQDWIALRGANGRHLSIGGAEVSKWRVLRSPGTQEAHA